MEQIFIRGYKRVYQGGHHDVYCNGRYHVWTSGGFCHPDEEPRVFKRGGPCDCKRWEAWGAVEPSLQDK